MNSESFNISTSQDTKLLAKSSIIDLFNQISLQNLQDEINDTVYYKCINKVDLMIIEKTSQTIREFMKFCNSNLFEDGKRKFLIQKFKGKLIFEYKKTYYFDLQTKQRAYCLTLNIKSVKDNSIKWSFMNVKNANVCEKEAYNKDIDKVKFIIKANVYLFNFKLNFLKMFKSKIDEFNNIIDKLKYFDGDVILQIVEIVKGLSDEFNIIYNGFLDELSLEKNTLKLVKAKKVFAVLNNSSSNPEIVEKIMSIFNEYTENLLSDGLLPERRVIATLHEIFSRSYSKIFVLGVSKYFSLKKQMFITYKSCTDDINYNIFDIKSLLNKDNKDLSNDIVKFCVNEYFIGDETAKINIKLYAIYGEFKKIIKSIKNFKCKNCAITHFIQLESIEKNKENFITTFLDSIDYLIRYQAQIFTIYEFVIFLIQLYYAKDDLNGNVTWNYYPFHLTNKWQAFKNNVLKPNRPTYHNDFERNIISSDSRYNITGNNIIISFFDKFDGIFSFISNVDMMCNEFFDIAFKFYVKVFLDVDDCDFSTFYYRNEFQSESLFETYERMRKERLAFYFDMFYENVQDAYKSDIVGSLKVVYKYYIELKTAILKQEL